MLRILIGDDPAIVRQGLRLVQALMPELKLVAEAKNGWEVIEHGPPVSLWQPGGCGEGRRGDEIQGSPDGVFTHGPVMGAHAGKSLHDAPCQAMCLF